MAMNIDFSDIDFENYGTWPVPVKVVALILAVAVTSFLGYWFDSKQQLKDLTRMQHEEITLRASFEQKQHKASNLDAYKEQMKTMKASFGAMLRQLPERTEVPGLLEDISHQGLATGLEFRSIRLQPENKIDFYVELPIEISVIGSYHQLAEFVNNVAALPRIVTLHDFDVRAADEKNPNGKLFMNIIAKTYRYTAGDEE
jgi:type IV pilus assembly protein PilO